MRVKVLLEKEGKWSVVPCKIRDAMLETGDRNFKYKSEAEAIAAIQHHFVEARHEYLPMIFGDSYRRVFVHREDMNQ